MSWEIKNFGIFRKNTRRRIGLGGPGHGPVFGTPFGPNLNSVSVSDHLGSKTEYMPSHHDPTSEEIDLALTKWHEWERSSDLEREKGVDSTHLSSFLG